MFVKVGNHIYDSESEPITIKFEGSEKMALKRLTNKQDIFTVFPSQITQETVDSLVAQNGKEKAAEMLKDMQKGQEARLNMFNRVFFLGKEEAPETVESKEGEIKPPTMNDVIKLDPEKSETPVIPISAPINQFQVVPPKE